MNTTNCITIPASALETPDYSEPLEEGAGRKTVKPETGDPVTFTIKGTVQAIEGGRAEVHVAFIDGKRVDEVADGEPNPGDSEETALRARAAQADGSNLKSYVLNLK